MAKIRLFFAKKRKKDFFMVKYFEETKKGCLKEAAFCNL